MTDETRIEVDPVVMLAALDQAAACASTDSYREAICGVHLHAQGGQLTAVGADGAQLIQVQTPINLPDDFEPRTYALDDVKRAVKAIKSYKTKDGPLTAELAGDTLELHAEHATSQAVKLARVAGTFPNYEQLIPPDGGACKIAVSVVALATIGKLARYIPFGIVRIYMGKDQASPFRVEWSSAEQWNTVMVLMPMFVRWEGDEA